MSKLEIYKKICLLLPESEETYPFGFDYCVMKVNNKMFAILNKEEISLKCDPDLALNYRDMYEGVREGYHLNKKYWNTVTFGSDVSKKAIIEMIIHSYECVVRKMTKNTREILLSKLEDQRELIK